ncbi:MAG: sulfatase-like hydrolase/transferase [Chloroflexi bacterium]|nr:sulfatase-like hydrolase/transferase [Chloroflexota bacterium]
MTAQNHPNVVVFFTDQQRWDSSGVHGNPLNLTPNFDRMAQQGTHVAHSFTCQPVCGPARACLQTGLYATKTGSFRNGIPLPPDQTMLGHHFRAAGYDTAYIGKWHLGNDSSAGPVAEAQRGGYDFWLASNLLEFTSYAYETTLYDNDNRPVRLPGYRVDALTDAAIRYLDGHRDKPFFLFTSYIEPHHQNQYDNYPAPTGYAEHYRGRWIPPDLATLGGSTHQHLAGYYGMIKRLDEALGRLLDALRSLDMLDNTIVLFSSDHGCHFKTRNSEYKRSCHESSIRVPTALQGPGFDGGGTIQQLVSLIDLPPTLLDAAGIAVPAEMQGHSILPLLRGKPAQWSDDVFVQISESQVGRAVRTHRWKYSVSSPKSDGWKDMNSDNYTEEFLYDLDSDPYELNNLIGWDSHAEVKTVMRERLLRRMVNAGEAAPTITPAATRHAGQLNVRPSEVHT